MNSKLHPAGVFMMFGVFCYAATLFGYYCICETMGLSEKEKKNLYVPGAKKAYQ
jgi:hypothetical protein